MKIALIGYGKMGKAIEDIAIAKGHQIVLRISSENIADFTKENLQTTDVAIEFTNPQSAVSNRLFCIDAVTPVVCGSTGWENQEEKIKQYCTHHNGTLLYASNFSIGVNIFFEINKKLASLMAFQKDYEVSISEIHHTQKKDAPSGTAITLANQIIALQQHKKNWTLSKSDDKNTITINSKRIDPAPGTHSVLYTSDIDDIEIIHTAHSRKGFALGAVLAAEFIVNKKGIYQMADVLGM